MLINDVTLTVRDLDAAADFYRRTLGMSVHEASDRAVVHAGASRLTLREGGGFGGVHHVAFGIAPREFERAYAWLSERIVLLGGDGSEVVVGPAGWNSRSVYFLGPEGSGRIRPATRR